MKIGVLGTGSIGMRHLNALKQLEGVEPIAIPVRSERILTLRQDGWNAASIDDAEVQGWIIATDTNRHLQDWTRLGQVPVLIEKPLADRVTDALMAACEATAPAWVGCCLRFHPAMNCFSDLVRKLGPHAVTIECRSDLANWRPDRDYRESYSARKNEGGALRELVHEIDYAGWLFGWPESVTGNTWHTGSLEIVEEEGASIEYEAGGTRVWIGLDLISTPTCRTMTAYIRNQTLQLDLVRSLVRISTASSEETLDFSHAGRDAMYIAQAQAFAEAIDSGNPGSLATVQEGLKAMQIGDAVRSNSKETNS